MSLAEEYRRQLAWRDWGTAMDALPLVPGQRVLDLGCAVGDQTALLVARGARVIGVDGNEELLAEARARWLEGAGFRSGDLCALPALGPVDGIWSSFAAAYFPDLPPVLAAWTKQLRPGGWVALTEVDDLFGHEPLQARSRGLLTTYAREALLASRYDFHMGGKLPAHAEACGLAVSRVLCLDDQELSFQGPARPEVAEAWRARLERMKLLRDLAGPDFPALRDDFLTCLQRADHRATATVSFVLATT